MPCCWGQSVGWFPPRPPPPPPVLPRFDPSSGQIATYNGGLDAPELAPRFLHLVLFKRLTIVGILARDHAGRTEEIADALRELLTAGSLVYRETVAEGFETLPTALSSLFTGANVGKMVVKA